MRTLIGFLIFALLLFASPMVAQGGFGLDYQISEAFSIRPSAKYSSLSRDTEIDAEVREVTHQYLFLGLGLGIRF